MKKFNNINAVMTILMDFYYEKANNKLYSEKHLLDIIIFFLYLIP
jgi:hypothetical protein